MECKEAEALVGSYMDHSLNGKELEEFLEHVESCPYCYEELETWFIVNEATRHLDQEDSESDLDFRELLKQDIRKRKKDLMFERFRLSVRWELLFLGGIGALAGAIYIALQFL